MEAATTLLEAARLNLEASRVHLEANRLHLEAVQQQCAGRSRRKRQRLVNEDNAFASVDTVTEFLRSGRLAFAKDNYMPFEEFSKAYESYVTSNGLTRVKLTGDRITHPLLEEGCKVVKNITLRYPKASKNFVKGRFVLGAGTT